MQNIIKPAYRITYNRLESMQNKITNNRKPALPQNRALIATGEPQQ